MHNGSMKLFKWGILSWLNTEDWGINPLSWSTRRGCVGVCIVASIWGKRGWIKCTWNSKVNYSIIRAISPRDFNGIVSGCSAAAADITSVLEHCTTIIGSKEKWPPKEYIPWNSQHLFHDLHEHQSPTALCCISSHLMWKIFFLMFLNHLTPVKSFIVHKWPTFAWIFAN